MEPTKLFYAKAVTGLMTAADALDEAGTGAVAARDDKLFGEIHAVRMKLWSLAESLIKDKNGNDQAG